MNREALAYVDTIRAYVSPCEAAILRTLAMAMNPDVAYVDISKHDLSRLCASMHPRYLRQCLDRLCTATEEGGKGLLDRERQHRPDGSYGPNRYWFPAVGVPIDSLARREVQAMRQQGTVIRLTSQRLRAHARRMRTHVDHDRRRTPGTA